MIEKQNHLFIQQVQSKQIIKHLRVTVTIAAFEINEGRDENLNTISSNISVKRLAQGVYLRPPGNTVYIMPPYCITQKELSKVYDLIDGLVD